MNGSTFIIRDARSDERQAIDDLTRAAYAEYAGIMEAGAWSGLSRALDDALAANVPAARIVAVETVTGADTLVGSVLLFPPATNAYDGAMSAAPCPELRLLAVAADQRKRGIGKALVEECARRAHACGAASLGLHTSRSMEVARHMYEQMGFVRVPELDFQPAGAELVEGFRLGLERPSQPSGDDMTSEYAAITGDEEDYDDSDASELDTWPDDDDDVTGEGEDAN